MLPALQQAGEKSKRGLAGFDPALTAGFVEGDANRGCEIEAAGLGLHGNPEEGVGMGGEEGFRQAAGFTSEEKRVAGEEVRMPVRGGGLGGEKPGASARMGFLPGGQVFPLVDVAGLPVVHSGAGELAGGDGKAEGFDEVEAGTDGEAGAGDVAGVLGDFRFEEDDVEAGGLRGLRSGLHDYPP